MFRSAMPHSHYRSPAENAYTFARDPAAPRLTGTSIGQSPGLVTDSYTYNTHGEFAEGWLATVSVDGVTTNYGYDANGNRTTVDGTILGEYDDQDRQTRWDTEVFTYTANGEVKTRKDLTTGHITQYTYDPLGNLVKVELPDGRVIEYTIDAQGRRVAKKIDGAVQHYIVYRDQLNPAAILNADGSFNLRFVYGSKPNVPDIVEFYEGGALTGRARGISDHLGSPRVAVNLADGSILGTWDYDVFGQQATPMDFPIGFAGGLYDVDTGLVRFGARDYDPKTGRWLSKDPIRFDGGVNLYLYANGDPVNWVDWTGREPLRGPITGPITAYQEASESAEYHYGGRSGGHGGLGDAYRHCVASCWLAQSLGTTYSSFLGWLAEVITIGPNPPEDRAMDDHNNACGRDFGKDPDTDCSLSCISAAENGELSTLR